MAMLPQLMPWLRMHMHSHTLLRLPRKLCKRHRGLNAAFRFLPFEACSYIGKTNTQTDQTLHQTKAGIGHRDPAHRGWHRARADTRQGCGAVAESPWGHRS